MKIHVYTVDFETPRWLRRAISYVVPIALVCGAGVAYANVTHTFQPNEVLKAADLNTNFTDLDTEIAKLDGRLTAVEATPEIVAAGGIVGKAGTPLTDNVYDSADLALSAGTWLVTGFATLKIAGNDDGVGLGLYDQTHGTDIPGSVGRVSVLALGTINAGFETSHVVTLSAPATLRLKAFRNGASTVSFEDFTAPSVAPLAALTPHKLKAVRLR